MSAVRRLNLADAPSARFGDDEIPEWTPVRHLLGVHAFGVNAFAAHAVGEPVVERHDEKPDEDSTNGHEEIYVVLEGEAEFEIAGEGFRAAAGEMVFIEDPSLERSARATVAPCRVLAVGAPRGEAFKPSPWEDRWLKKAGLD